jgi:MFS family permease
LATNVYGWTVGKAQIKSYSSGAMAILLLVVVRYYGRLASAVPRQKLVTYVTLFFISNLVVFYLLAKTAVTAWLGIAFFIWVGIFNNMVVSQFWAFANDVYRPDQGKRLFPIVGFGASSGAVGGSWIAGKLVVLGEPNMLVWAAVILGSCIVCTNIVHRREAANRLAASGTTDAEKPVGTVHIAISNAAGVRERALRLLAGDLHAQPERSLGALPYFSWRVSGQRCFDSATFLRERLPDAATIRWEQCQLYGEIQQASTSASRSQLAELLERQADLSRVTKVFRLNSGS